MDNTPESGLARDVLIAVGANLAAFALAFIAYLLVVPMPIGMIAVYCLLVGFYANSQIQKRRRRRAVLAGSIATIGLLLLIYVGTHLTIA